MGMLSNFNIPVLAFILCGPCAARLSRQQVIETGPGVFTTLAATSVTEIYDKNCKFDSKLPQFIYTTTPDV